MDRKPHVTRMVMFKHGVAYLERGGPADGSFDLSFQRDEMNDVLKSLAAWVVAGDGKITSFGFRTPGDAPVGASDQAASLAHQEALDALIASLRGRTIEVEDGGQGARGEVLGLQHRMGPFGEQRAALLLRARSGSVVLVDLQSVHTVHMLDPVSRERLALVVTRSQAMTAGDTRFVHVAMEGSAQDVRLAYVIPAPAWRVSYRLVRDGEGATLMAMGIVHNPVDEDLEGVDLTLTTGQPVSFVIDLYHPKEVRRPELEEETRASAAPTPHERAKGGRAMKRAPHAAAPATWLASGPAREILAEDAMSEAFAAAEGASEGVERGELFEYNLKTPVSIQRGGSAMVPLAAARVAAEVERIWRRQLGRHPDLVFAFDNDSGLVLEEGPAVIYDEGVYAGESMLPYSPRGAPVKMTFAKDLAVGVSSSTQTSIVVAGVRIVEGGILEEKRQELHHTIEAESDHDEAVTLIIEIPRVLDHTLTEDSAQPFEETAHQRRFKLEVPAHGHAELSVGESWTLSRRVAMESLDAHDVARWFKDRHLDDATFRALSRVLALRDKIMALGKEKERVEADQAAAYAKQAKISQQLGVLKETGAEGALRLRYVKELEAEQNKVNAAEAELRRITGEIDEARRQAKEELARLVTP